MHVRGLVGYYVVHAKARGAPLTRSKVGQPEQASSKAHCKRPSGNQNELPASRTRPQATLKIFDGQSMHQHGRGQNSNCHPTSHATLTTLTSTVRERQEASKLDALKALKELLKALKAATLLNPRLNPTLQINQPCSFVSTWPNFLSTRMPARIRPTRRRNLIQSLPSPR